MKVETFNIGKFCAHTRSLRKNDRAVERMTASIREFGFKIPVLARTDGEVVDGDLRLKAAKKLGMTEVPVILCDEWTAEQVKAFRMLVNRSATWASWDLDLVCFAANRAHSMRRQKPRRRRRSRNQATSGSADPTDCCAATQLLKRMSVRCSVIARPS